jgi:hypothetical protein
MRRTLLGVAAVLLLVTVAGVDTADAARWGRSRGGIYIGTGSPYGYGGYYRGGYRGYNYGYPGYGRGYYNRGYNYPGYYNQRYYNQRYYNRGYYGSPYGGAGIYIPF